MNWRSVRFLFFFFSPGFLVVNCWTPQVSHINPSSPIILHVLLSFFAPFFSFIFFLPAPPFFGTILNFVSLIFPYLCIAFKP